MISNDEIKDVRNCRWYIRSTIDVDETTTIVGVEKNEQFIYLYVTNFCYNITTHLCFIYLINFKQSFTT